MSNNEKLFADMIKFYGLSIEFDENGHLKVCKRRKNMNTINLNKPGAVLKPSEIIQQVGHDTEILVKCHRQTYRVRLQKRGTGKDEAIELKITCKEGIFNLIVHPKCVLVRKDFDEIKDLSQIQTDYALTKMAHKNLALK